MKTEENFVMKFNITVGLIHNEKTICIFIIFFLSFLGGFHGSETVMPKKLTYIIFVVYMYTSGREGPIFTEGIVLFKFLFFSVKEILQKKKIKS